MLFRLVEEIEIFASCANERPWKVFHETSNRPTAGSAAHDAKPRWVARSAERQRRPLESSLIVSPGRETILLDGRRGVTFCGGQFCRRRLYLATPADTRASTWEKRRRPTADIPWEACRRFGSLSASYSRNFSVSERRKKVTRVIPRLSFADLYVCERYVVSEQLRNVTNQYFVIWRERNIMWSFDEISLDASYNEDSRTSVFDCNEVWHILLYIQRKRPYSRPKSYSNLHGYYIVLVTIEF